MPGQNDRRIPFDLAVVDDEGRIVVEVRNDGEDAVIDLELIAGIGKKRLRHSRRADGTEDPVGWIDPGEAVVLTFDGVELDDHGDLRTLVCYFADGRTRCAVTTIHSRDA